MHPIAPNSSLRAFPITSSLSMPCAYSEEGFTQCLSMVSWMKSDTSGCTRVVDALSK
ncbi:hypothetical protein LJC49_04355 [Ruminococcaceae bacterium OttesenSCG-928-I18]|nr:hypothetical protein [Ruminococcaceae bacterium OttesenSCG-928-I18]